MQPLLAPSSGINCWLGPSPGLAIYSAICPSTGTVRSTNKMRRGNLSSFQYRCTCNSSVHQHTEPPLDFVPEK